MSPIGMDDSQLSVVEKETLGECFASAEARFEYEKARRLRRVAMLVGGVVVLVGFGLFMYRLGGGGRRHATDGTATASDGDSGKPLDIKPVGSPQAKVQIIAILPVGSDCHNNVATLLSGAATKRPEKIRVEFTTMAEYGEKKLESQVGSVCAAVLINGASTFEVTCGGTLRKVSLVGTEPTHYSLADLGEALTSVFVQQYGDPGEPIHDAPAGSTCSDGHGAGDGKSCSGPSSPATPAAEDTTPLELPGFREMKPKH